MIPDWWMDALHAAIDRLPREGAEEAVDRRGRPRDLVALLVPANLRGVARDDVVNAVTVKVHRFLSGKNRSLETAEEIREALNLPRFHFDARDPVTAKAMELADEDPEAVLAAVSMQRRVREEVRSQIAELSVGNATSPDPIATAFARAKLEAELEAEERAIGIGVDDSRPPPKPEKQKKSRRL